MIDMSKKKNEEIKGFFKWLEREIEANIENFKNKTTLKEFHNYNFDKFLDVLKENQKNITINLLERKTQERLEKHFNDSISILEPLKTRIKVTDDLIDEIVYRLYGLTEEEIKIIEGKI
jgi:16S rRNA G527 N7-methylase RsmG